MWVNGPLRLGAEGRVLRPGCRSVLVVVPSVVAGARLMDVLPLLEADHRLMTVFTVAPAANGANCHGVEEFLCAAGGFVIPWARAVQTEFDIILAAGTTGVAQLRGRVVLPPLGGIAYERLWASVAFRDRYRAAFGLAANQELVVLSSTWGPGSALGRHYNLAERLVTELRDDRYRVAAILHPDIWFACGTFQVRAWLADALRKGLLLLPPEEGWRAALVAADVLVGDHGLGTRYGAALGTRVLLTPFGDERVPGGSADPLVRSAPYLRPELPLTNQIATARTGPWQADLDARLTAGPGRTGEALRRRLYRLLELPEPARAVPVSPVPLPKPITWEPR